MKKVILLSGLAAGMFFMANCAKKTTGSLATTNKPATSETVTQPITSEPVNQSIIDSINKATNSKVAVSEINKMPIEEQIKEGKLIWHANCGKCHELYSPTSRSRVKWEQILPVMVKKAKLADDKASLVHTYIMSMVEG